MTGAFPGASAAGKGQRLDLAPDEGEVGLYLSGKNSRRHFAQVGAILIESYAAHQVVSHFLRQTGVCADGTGLAAFNYRCQEFRDLIRLEL